MLLLRRSQKPISLEEREVTGLSAFSNQLFSISELPPMRTLMPLVVTPL
jgi:hypothetical protein